MFSAQHAVFGGAVMRQTRCKHCGFDIEGAARDWRDRGSDSRCPEFCGYDEDVIPVYRKRQKHEPVPTDYSKVSELTRTRPPTPGRPRLRVPR